VLLHPLDLIPDFIPIVGNLDDLILVPIGIALALKLVPATVIADCRARAQADEGRPVSRVGAAFIIAVWLLVAAFGFLFVRNLLPQEISPDDGVREHQMGGPTVVPAPAVPMTRTAAARRGLLLEGASAAWMLVEAALALGAGLAARSVLLTAFGFDSVIELVSAVLLIWRLAREAGGGDLGALERIEVRATKVSAVLLVLLCLYVVTTSIAGLVAHVEPEGSILGIAVAAAAVAVMPALAVGKRRVNAVLNSAALKADIAETAVCAWMAGTVLVGVALTTTFGWWWAEYVAAAGLLYWLVGETREAVEAARAGRA